MSLVKYNQKRRFNRTPEPRGKSSQQDGPLRFVVQKHQASRLHYDFRLELDGTLKSWAVPKGPSLNPQDKRLAMMVEDHPLDYRTFEGIIPEGNYGAGTVMVWDEGTFSARSGSSRKDSEVLLREGLEKGSLSFVLHGKKLKGDFSLVRLRRGKENAWLLVKKRDEWATEYEVTNEGHSSATGRSLDEIAQKEPAKRNGKGSRKTKYPRQIKPMLATLVERPFDKPGWFFELKWDGDRAIAEVTGQKVFFYSRNHKSFEQRFKPIVESLQHLGHETVLDGEVVVVDEQGKSRFQLLQNYQKTGEGALQYYIFDILYLDGRDLRFLPLKRRKVLLQKILGKIPNVFFSEHVEEKGIAFFKAAVAQGLEGIIAKEGNSLYREGIRSHSWLKIKAHRQQEAIICGFTEPKGSRKDLGALVLGVYNNHHLEYIGHTGGGLNRKGLANLRSRLNPLVQSVCPFPKKPKTNAPVHWVKPELVCEVSFQEWTEDGIMRQPIFLGLREDKGPIGVHREKPEPVIKVLLKKDQKVAAKKPSLKEKPQKTGNNKPGQNKKEDISDDFPFTHLEKLYWPKEGITKGDMVNYYREIAEILLPYLRDRPQSLHRHPNGVTGKSFFQKDISRQTPPGGVTTIKIPSESDGKEITYLVCQDLASLLYLANLGCIEINPWNSRIGSLDNPDYLVIDLDPEAVPFQKVVETALVVRRTLEKAGAESLCKTSGKRGLHVFVPLGARYDYDLARRFAEIIANLVRRQLPNSTSVVRSPSLRQQRIYLDYLQNRRGQTLAAPYSVRPYPGATVSTPLRWQEVKKGLDPGAFTLRTMLKRLEKVGDLWAPIFNPGIDLKACLIRLEKD